MNSTSTAVRLKFAYALLLLVFLACSAGDSSNTTSARGVAASGAVVESTPPPRPMGPAPTVASQPSPTTRNVTLEFPREGEPIRSNPIRISGTARTFENHVSVRLRDEKGQIIARSFATATGDLGTFNPWEVEVFMTSWPGNRLIVEAFDVSAKDGSEQSLVKVSAPMAVEPRELELYFHDPKRAPTDCSQVFPAKRRAPSSVSLARLVVEALIAGPLPSEAGESAASSFPRGSQVRGIAIRDGVAIVDFGQELQNVGGSCRSQAIRASVERSLKAVPGITRVVITAGGSEKLALQP